MMMLKETLLAAKGSTSLLDSNSHPAINSHAKLVQSSNGGKELSLTNHGAPTSYLWNNFPLKLRHVPGIGPTQNLCISRVHRTQTPSCSGRVDVYESSWGIVYIYVEAQVYK